MLRSTTGSGGDRQQLLLDDGRKKVRLAEVAGGTTAECAAVCCCCPCGIAKLLVLTVYQLPAGLCKKALRKQRHRRLLKKGREKSQSQCFCDRDETHDQFHVHHRPLDMVDTLECTVSDEDTEVIELEKEMWDKFYATGFWRSPSQRSSYSTDHHLN